MHEANSLSFSVITPTWNRAALLQRVYKSLVEQTYTSFEWIVADDGSTDDTQEIISSLVTKCMFPIRYIRFDLHVGKPTVDNAAIRLAEGELSLWCDSDDWLMPNALKDLWQIWTSIPGSQKTEYSGVTALAATEAGCIANPFPGVELHDISWNDLYEKYQVQGDMLFCARTDLLKANPFPEVDLVVPESSVWVKLGFLQARLLSRVLKMVEYRCDDGISLVPVMNYNRGRAYSLAITARSLQTYNTSLKLRLKSLCTFIRYSLHAELSLSKARALWAENSNSLVYWMMFPMAFLLVCRDRLQGKVRYSHREFLANRGRASVTDIAFSTSV